MLLSILTAQTNFSYNLKGTTYTADSKKSVPKRPI